MANNVVCKLLIDVYFDGIFDSLDYDEKNIADIYIVQDMVDVINKSYLYNEIYLVRNNRIYIQYDIQSNTIIIANFLRNYFFSLYHKNVFVNNRSKLCNLFGVNYNLVESITAYNDKQYYKHKSDWVNWSSIEIKLMEENDVV